MSATMKAASLPKPSAAAPILSFYSTKSKKRITTSSILCCKFLDDGRLTDGQGRTVDFKNVIVIMTSNIGSHRILEYKGAYEGTDYARMKEAVLGELRQQFRPEFLNRLDEIIVFHSLSEEHLKQIVDIQLMGVRARLEERHIMLELTDAARTRLVRSGYDPTYGARPLKRAIQREIETPLAKQILGGAVRDGQTVYIDADPAGGGLRFETKKPHGKHPPPTWPKRRVTEGIQSKSGTLRVRVPPASNGESRVQQCPRFASYAQIFCKFYE